MSSAVQCPGCGTPLPANAPQGLCPQCLLRGALDRSADVEQGPSVAEEAGPAKPSGQTAPHRPVAPPKVEELASHFPHLDILELLGQGGMGSVYRARQKTLDRLVALKILSPDAEKDPTFAERFAREARAMAKLTHPNIVLVFEFGETNGMYYLMMEYVDGINLREALHDGQLSSEQALMIVPQICEALQYAHEEGVVHRDVKPENVLLDKRGRVKIADFGLAKLMGRSPIDITLTASHQVMGTIHYMAPEQLEKPLSVDHRADIYSLGVVFYELLTGELPLGRFKLPSEKAPIDTRLDQVVLRSLEREPQARYQHVSELRTDVQQISESSANRATRDANMPQRADVPRGADRGAASLPVVLSKHGMRIGAGVFRLEEQELVLEVDVSERATAWWAFHTEKPGWREVRIPLDQLASFSMESGWWHSNLRLQSHSVRALSQIPSSDGVVLLARIAGQDEEASREFVRAVQIRMGCDVSLMRPSTADDQQAVRSARFSLKPPLIGLSICGCLGIVGAYLSLVFVVFATIFYRRYWHGDDGAVPLAICLCCAIAGSLACLAPRALAMRSYPLAMATAVLALAPLLGPIWILSLPLGIWSLLILARPDVKLAFRKVSRGDVPPPPTLIEELISVYFQRATTSRDSVQLVRGPAIALVVLGVIEIVLPLMAMFLFRALELSDEAMLWVFCSFPCGVFILLAGLFLYRLRYYGMVWVGSVLAVISLMGIPIGIWAISILLMPEVYAAFRSRRAEETSERKQGKPDHPDHFDADAVRFQLRGPAFGLMLVAAVTAAVALIPIGLTLYSLTHWFFDTVLGDFF